MGVEQVRVHTAARPVAGALVVADRAQEVLDEEVRAVALAEARPEVDLPSERPTRPVVPPDLQRPPRGREVFAGRGRDPAARVRAEEMRGMPVVDFRLHEVLGPLLQLAARADLQRVELRARGFEPGRELGLVAGEDRGADLGKDRQAPCELLHLDGKVRPGVCPTISGM